MTPDTSNASASPGSSFATTNAAESDLGFGRVAAQAVRGRFLSPDGHSTARKLGLRGQRTEQLYLTALAAPWPRFLLWLIGGVLLVNGLFALGYRSHRFWPGPLSSLRVCGNGPS